jgi:hypothetical protein
MPAQSPTLEPIPHGADLQDEAGTTDKAIQQAEAITTPEENNNTPPYTDEYNRIRAYEWSHQTHK